MANKVKYGLSNCYYAVLDETAGTYSNPVALPGAVSLSLDQEGETNNFRADNMNYYVSVSNNGYEGDWELAKLPDDVLTEILGFVDDSNGVLVEDAGAAVKHFALAFQFEGDAHARRHILYNCTMSRPSVSGSTKEETIEPQTESVTITATSIYNATLDKDIVKASATQADSATAYAAWFTTAYQPT